MSRRTTTSYAVLGLLAIRPFTTYEIAQQMDRSLRYLWPRTQSRIYEEPKQLVADGLAEATRDHVGRRPRTTYSITPAGREALAAWLQAPGAGPSLEFEAVLKIFFAEQTTKEAVLANIGAARAWAEEQHAQNVAMARLYVETGGPFPGREATISLVGPFITAVTDAVLAWSLWAEATVAQWPDDGSPEPAWGALRAIAARPLPGEVVRDVADAAEPDAEPDPDGD